MISSFLERFRESTSLIREIDTLRKDLLSMERRLSASLTTIKQLESVNRDIGKQLTEKLKQRLMSDAEFEKLNTITLEIGRLQSEQNELALWLRNNRVKEIERGDHKGLRLTDVIIRYLARGKKLEEKGSSIPVKVIDPPSSQGAIQ